MGVMRRPSVGTSTAIVVAIMAFGYGLFERSAASGLVGLPDVVGSVITSRPFATFILLPAALVAVASFVHVANADVVRVRRGSAYRSVAALVRESAQGALFLLIAGVLGSWAATIGLPPLNFSGAGSAVLDESAPVWITLIAQFFGLACFVMCVTAPLSLLAATGRGSIGLLIAASTGLWLIAAGALNGLWGEAFARPVYCAAIHANCATWAEGLATSTVLVGAVTAALLLISSILDRRLTRSTTVGKPTRSLVASVLIPLLTVPTALAIAGQFSEESHTEVVVQVALSGNPSSPLTFLLALCSFVVMLLFFSLRLDGASAGFADLELLRSGSWAVAAARTFISASRIAIVVRAAVLLATWLPIAISGRPVSGAPEAFVVGAVHYVIVGSLWWGLLALAVAFFASRLAHITMIVPAMCGTAVAVQLSRIAVGDTVWPALDVFVEPSSLVTGRVIEGALITLVGAVIILGGRAALWRVRRASMSVTKTQETTS